MDNFYSYIENLLFLPGNVITFIALCWLVKLFIQRVIVFFFCKPIDSTNKAILITGCDQGLGHGIALMLNSLGFKVFATCYNPKSSSAQSLLTNCTSSDRMIIFKLDVTKDRDIDEAVNFVSSQLTSNEVLWAVINNAGLSRTGKAEWGSFDYHYRDLFEVNTFAVVKVTRAFLPLLRKAKGRLVILSSFGGRIASSYMAAYSMSKAAIIAFADGLRLELTQFGVKVISIEPTFARTPMTTPEVSDKRIDYMWSQTSDEVKAAYGEDQIVQIKETIRILNSSSLGLDETYKEILKCTAKALLSPDPEHVFQPTSLGQRPIIFISQLVSRDLVDFCLKCTEKFIVNIIKLRRKYHSHRGWNLSIF